MYSKGLITGTITSDCHVITDFLFVLIAPPFQILTLLPLQCQTYLSFTTSGLNTLKTAVGHRQVSQEIKQES